MSKGKTFKKLFMLVHNGDIDFQVYWKARKNYKLAKQVVHDVKLQEVDPNDLMGLPTEPTEVVTPVTIKTLYVDEFDEACERSMPISDAHAHTIINQPMDDNGRSQWHLIRLASGELVLACYPRGDTYIATEAYREDL